MNNKFCILFILIFAFANNVNAQSSDDTNHFIFLVRHAEKASDGTKDPPLTKEGEKRAEKLAMVLASAGISALYSTDYKRTRSTVQPMAQSGNMDINLYLPSDAEFIKAIRTAKGNIVISGHSNSIPSLVNKLLGTKEYPQLNEDQYDHIYVVCRIGDAYGAAIMKY